MSGRKTLIWALVLLGLAAFYYLYEVQGGKKRQEVASQQTLLAHVVPDSVTGLTLERDHETVRAEKRQGHWYLTEPLAVPGDHDTYQHLVHYVSELHYTRRLEEHPETLEPFGLDHPALTIQLTGTDATLPVTLRLGKANPTNSSYYAQVSGQSAVYLVAAATKDVLNASLYDLRDKTLLSFMPAEVQEIQLHTADPEPVVLQHPSDSTWRLTAPVQAQADTAQVQTLLNRLYEVRVKTFVAEQPDDLTVYGLQAPVLQVQLHLAGATAPLPTLLIGKLDPEAQGVYAKRSDTPGVVLLPQDFWDALPKTATTLRDKTLLRFDRDHVARLDMQFPERHLLFTQTRPNQYRLEQPEAAPGDTDTITNLLWDIHELKAQDFITESPDSLTAYGLDPPRLRLTLWPMPTGTETPPPAQTLRFGAEAPQGKGVYVQREGTATVYLVEAAAAQRLMQTSAFDLRNKKLFTFASETIQKVQVRYPTTQFTFERQGETWKLSEPGSSAAIQNWKVENILYEMSTVAYTRMIADPVADRHTYGFETPQIQITLWQRDGAMVGPLVVGKPSDSEVAGGQTAYAQIDQQAPLYVIKTDFLAHMPKTLADFTATN